MKGMRIFEGLEGVKPSEFSSPVATLGTFDGVHIGHRAVIEHLLDWARELDGEGVVITFRRHPRLVLSGRAPARITSFEKRLSALEDLGGTYGVSVQGSLRDEPYENYQFVIVF